MKFLLSFLLLAASLIPSFGQGQGKNTRYFNTVADLLASNPNDANRAVWLLGLNSISDNLGGLWFWFPNSTTATNLTTVFQANSTATGRWEKINLPNTADVDTSGFVTNFTVITVRDIPTLKTIAVDRGIQAVIVRGYFDPNDKGEGIFVYDATSAEPEDGGRVIAPNNGAGKWIRVATPEIVYATWFSPTVTNGTLRIAVDYAASATKGTVIMPGVDIYWNGEDPVYIPSRVTVMGQTGTRLITSDNPATSYSSFVLSDVEAAGVQNMVIIGWNNPPGGDVNNTGCAIAMTNCTNCLLGGIVYQDLYTQPLIIGSGVSGNGNKFYDENWVYNSVRGYGALGDYTHNDTAAIHYALANGKPQVTEAIQFPSGQYSCNVTQTVGNVVLHGTMGFTGLQSGVNYTNAFFPWDPTQPTWTIGDSSALMKGPIMENFAFNGAGPNGQGLIGLLIVNSDSGRFMNVSALGFANVSLDIDPGPFQVTKNEFYNSTLQAASVSAIAAFRIRDGVGGATGNELIGPAINGTGFGHAMWIENSPITVIGGYIQFSAVTNTGIMLTNGGKIYMAGTKVDTSATAVGVFIEMPGFAANLPTSQQLIGTYTLNDNIRILGDANQVRLPYPMGVGSSPYFLSPISRGQHRFIDSTDVETTDGLDFTNVIYKSGRHFVVENRNPSGVIDIISTNLISLLSPTLTSISDATEIGGDLTLSNRNAFNTTFNINSGAKLDATGTNTVTDLGVDLINFQHLSSNWWTLAKHGNQDLYIARYNQDAGTNLTISVTSQPNVGDMITFTNVGPPTRGSALLVTNVDIRVWTNSTPASPGPFVVTTNYFGGPLSGTLMMYWQPIGTQAIDSAFLLQQYLRVFAPTNTTDRRAELVITNNNDTELFSDGLQSYTGEVSVGAWGSIASQATTVAHLAQVPWLLEEGTGNQTLLGTNFIYNGLYVVSPDTHTNHLSVNPASGAVDVGKTLSYGLEGGTSVVPVGKDSSGRLTTNSVSYFNLVGTAYRGGDQTGNAQGATALDVQSERSTATKVASGSTSVAVGANNTASSTSSVALGGSNTASGTQAVAVGVQNTASGANNSSAIGNFNTASATGSTAIGYSAKSAVQFSVNVGGQIFTRRDNAESHGGTSLPGDYNYFSGTEVIIWSGEVDLKTEIGYTNTIPSGVHFFPNEVGLVLTTANTVTGQPTISFGVLGTLAKYLAATATTGLTANFDRQRFQTLLTAAGLSSTDTMTVTISANATGTTVKGRFYWKGFLLQDQ